MYSNELCMWMWGVCMSVSEVNASIFHTSTGNALYILTGVKGTHNIQKKMCFLLHSVFKRTEIHL